MPDRAPTSAGCRVLVVDPVHPWALDTLRSRYAVTVHLGPSATDLARLLTDTHVLVLRSGVRLTAELLAGAPVLHTIARAGAGVDNIDIDAARALAICVFNVPGRSALAVAELTFALLLAAARHVALADRDLRAGRWRKAELVGMELSGRTLGVVGLGATGGAVARLGRAFDKTVIATVDRDDHDRSRDAATRGIHLVPFETLLAEADVVTLHVPLTPRTRHLVGASQLAQMKRSSILVNMSRGGVVDEEALVRALRDEVIAGAGLDVFDREGEASPLFALNNVVCTPHLGAMTHQSQERVARALIEGIERSLDGRLVLNRVC